MTYSTTKNRTVGQVLLASVLAILLCVYSVPMAPVRAYADDGDAQVGVGSKGPTADDVSSVND